MSGLLISFDGLDSSGKATQVNRLCARLEAAGKQVLKLDTPDYTTPSGKELKLRLQGKLGDWGSTPWQEKMGYFATNRAEHKDEIVQTLNDGGVVVYDRYVPSSLVFMVGEAKGSATREEIFAAVEELEYNQHGMPREHISIFLDVPATEADKLLQQRKGGRGDEDEYTDQLEVQQGMYDEYVRLAQEHPERFLRIDCMDGARLRTPDEIERLIWEAVSSKFSL